MEQKLDNYQRFTEMLGEITGIDKNDIFEGLKKHGFTQLIDNPSLLDISKDQLDKFTDAIYIIKAIGEE